MVGIALLIGVVVALAILVAMAVVAVARRRIPGFKPRRRRPLVGGGGRDQGLQGEDALVPLGPPRKPRPAAAVALPLPEPEPEPVEAYGREVADGAAGTDALAS